MFTQKRFTPDLLDYFRRIGRGLGIYETYVPWHRVGRMDPSSRGRSHLQYWRGRLRELLSDKEWIGFLFATMLPSILDCREQFPLSLDSANHEMAAYLPMQPWSSFPGTKEIAKQLNFKHPLVHDYRNKQSADWVMTTDFLVLVEQQSGNYELIAVAVKLDNEIETKRSRQKLEIERQYWLARGVQWLLVTPSTWHPRVGDTLRQSMPWSLGQPVENSAIEFVFENQSKWQGRSVTNALETLTSELGNSDFAQRAFWQAAWSARMPLDLRRGWRPHEPITYLSESEFWSLNPIASRRSAWTA